MTDATHEAEAALLGAMIERADARKAAVDQLTPDAFDREAHRAVFVTLAAMHADGIHVDPVTVNDELALRGRLDEAGGLAAVWTLVAIEGCPVPEAWRSYLAIVDREASRRQTVRQLRRAIERLEAGEDPANVRSGLEVAA